METTPGGVGVSSENNIMAAYTRVRGVSWFLQIRTVADALPVLMQPIVTSGKMSALFFFGGYLVFISLWFPFYMLSFVVSEWGVYGLALGFIFLVGRSIIRMIAFPGSSYRVSSEIEKEFAKYSVRMILSSTNSLIDVGSALSSVTPGGPDQSSQSGNFAYYEIPSLWKRAKSYRDRVLAVYAETLNYLLNDRRESSSGPQPDLNKYGNNKLSGDIGDLSGLTYEARADGKLLLEHLMKVISETDRLEAQARPILESTNGAPQPLSSSVKMSANNLVIVASELRDFVESLKPPSSGDAPASEDDDEEDLSMDAVRRRFEEQNGSLMDSAKNGLSSLLAHVDPPPHTSIFGFDVQRGIMLSRYRGARQFWVQRPGGGMIDVLHFPAKSSGPSLPRNPKAVMYCNPNAGLIEVATGMSLGGGNVASDVEGVVNDNCWTDFYTNLGFDVYLFNYAGFGRSYGAGYCGIGKRGGEEPYVQGVAGRIRKICHSTFCGFQPTPDSLREDGLAVGSYLVNHLGIDNLVIHGESIGGVAASATANKLTQSAFTKDKLSLLICDRTFCNLEAVAQRLVGGWSGYAIRMLAPFWSTDVAAHFLAASCPKVVATDSADAIIADTSSLKSGISIWKEIYRGAKSTKAVGWVMEAPVQYRMADFENVCVNDSRYVQSSFSRTTAPVWPADKYITLEEAFHFAACVKRIGKVASIEKKKFVTAMGGMGGVELGPDTTCQSPTFLVWKYLGCCDGLCGSALGMAVKGGFDCTVTWLCSTLTFGGQTVVEAMEHRTIGEGDQSLLNNKGFVQLGGANPSDFDCRPEGFEQQESESVVHPKPIPEVLGMMKQVLDENHQDEVLRSVSHELAFVIGTLEYVVARLSSPVHVEWNWKNRNFHVEGPMMVGSFMNLHCGHNNPFSVDERKRLASLLHQAVSRTSNMNASSPPAPIISSA